nr:unnamed protein product [Callosobruchus chinensis]
MESHMVLVEGAMKLAIELVEVKIESPELDSKLVVVPSSYQLSNKDDGYKYANNKISNRMKDDYKNRDPLEAKSENIKLETELDSNESGKVIFKNVLDFCTSMDGNSNIILNRIKEGPNNSVAWNNCDDGDVELAYIKLERNPDIEKLIAKKIAEGAFKNKDVLSSVKPMMPRKQDNMVRKETRKKTFICYNCSYTAYYKQQLISHMKQHQDHNNTITCVHCTDTFNSKKSLDDHTIRNHEIYKCKHCVYGTRLKNKFDRHILKHSNE